MPTIRTELPINLQLHERPCLVVGGGPVAARKARQLLAAGARVTLVAPELGHDAWHLVASGEALHRDRLFTPEDLDGMMLVVAASNDHPLNHQIAAWCAARGVLVNVVDDGPRSTFTFPAVVKRGALQIAISTTGLAPALARRLKTELEARLPAFLDPLTARLSMLRPQVKRLGDARVRRAAWNRLLHHPALVAPFDPAAVEAAIGEMLDHAATPATGHVALVGAGPGDPDLLTLKALRLLQAADVVVHDRLVSAAILALARPEAMLIDAGKSPRAHNISQEEIATLLIQHAREGLLVVRLKGGDPFIFGRGGEEMAALAQAGVPFSVVPGITAAVGCAAAARIPLTHRQAAQGLRLITAHRQAGRLELPWQELAQSTDTLVFYMALGTLECIAQGLLQHGMAPTMPAALIEQGTMPKQRVLHTTLTELARQAAAMAVCSPALLLVGAAVGLAQGSSPPGSAYPFGFEEAGLAKAGAGNEQDA